MPKLNELSVVIQSSQGPAFFSGQIVQGHVILDLAEPMTMRGLRIHVVGQANVHWSETRGSGNNRRRVHYRAQETYLNQIIVAYGKAPDQGGSNPDHPAGKYTYPFQFQIPPTAPSSFEGGIGHVRYIVGAVIDRPWKFDHVSKVAFTVVNLLDLNREPQLMSGSQNQNSKTICCLCCASGPITGTFQINRQGYVPGEHVPCYGEITNHSRRVMRYSCIKLVQVVVFRACGRTRVASRILQTIQKGEIPPGETQTWNGETIQIPAVPPSRLQGCNIIDMKYLLMLVVVPAGLGFDLDVTLEIVIGSVPHWSIVQQYNPQIKAPTGGTADPVAADAEPPIAFPEGIPLPKYSESVEGKVNIREDGDSEHTRGNMEYSPMYPYYDWGRAHNPDGLTVQGYTGGLYGDAKPDDSD